MSFVAQPTCTKCKKPFNHKLTHKGGPFVVCPTCWPIIKKAQLLKAAKDKATKENKSKAKSLASVAPQPPVADRSTLLTAADASLSAYRISQHNLALHDRASAYQPNYFPSPRESRVDHRLDAPSVVSSITNQSFNPYDPYQFISHVESTSDAYSFVTHAISTHQADREDKADKSYRSHTSSSSSSIRRSSPRKRSAPTSYDAEDHLNTYRYVQHNCHDASHLKHIQSHLPHAYLMVGPSCLPDHHDCNMLAGLGLYTTKPIAAGTRIDSYRGVTIPDHQTAANMSLYNPYILDLTDAACPYSCWCRYVNDCLSGDLYNARFIWDSHESVYYLVATCHINPFDEIYAPYGVEHFLNIPPTSGLYPSVVDTYGAAALAKALDFRPTSLPIVLSPPSSPSTTISSPSSPLSVATSSHPFSDNYPQPLALPSLSQSSDPQSLWFFDNAASFSTTNDASMLYDITNCPRFLSVVSMTESKSNKSAASSFCLTKSTYAILLLKKLACL